MQSTVVCRAQAGARPTARAGSVPKPAAKILPKVGGLAAGLLSGAGVARADELALPDLPSLPEVNLPDAAAVADAASDIGSLFADNPLLVGGGLALLLVPVGINVILNLGGSGQKINTTTAARALEALGENPKVILVDIRSKAEVKEQGTPDLKSVKRKAVTLPYTSVVKGEEVVDEAFGAKFAKLGGLDAESRVILIDATGAQVAAAAKQILAAGVVDKVYVVEGGAVGAKGWKEGGLPWKEPGKGLELPSLDFKGLGSLNLAATIDTLTEDFQSAPTLAKAGLAAAGIAGAGFLLINEINLVLEVVGLLAAGQFALKLLFAEEREQTLTEIRTLVNDKIAVTEAGEDLKKLATVLLEEPAGEGKPVAAEAKPAAAEAKPAAAEAPKPAPAAEPAPAAAVAAAPAEGSV